MDTDDIRDLKDRVVRLETVHAVRDERDKSISARLLSIEGTLTWLVRLVIGALILAVVGFAMNGGLVIG